MNLLQNTDNSGLTSGERKSLYPALAPPALFQNMLVMLILLLIVFGDILFLPGRQVLSMFGADLSALFVYNRYFGFQELLKGNFPLWNPYLFCGIPYFGLFDSALLYPLNWIFLILPLKTALNWNIVSHIFLLGLMTYLWAAYLGMNRFSALLAGTLSMFCGPGFLHVFAGHLTIVCAMPWVPLIFLVIDGGWQALSNENSKARKEFLMASWGGVGVLAICFQVLAGHPQTVFVTAIAAGFYAVFKTAGNVKRWPILLFVGAIYITGAILSAVQITAGIAANQDSIRTGGVFYEFAAMCSFPPENLITLIVPAFFGDMRQLPYWGRWYLWEMNIYISVTGFMLLCLGIKWCIKNRRLTWPMTLLMLLILSFGDNTPLFNLLYHYVPGFDVFRGSSKFILPGSLFIAMIAALAYEHIQQAEHVEPAIVFVCFAISFLCLIGILFLWHQGLVETSSSLWGKFLQVYAGSKEVYLPRHHFQQNKFISDTAYLSQLALSLTACLFLIAGALFYFVKTPKFLKHIIFLLLAFDLVMFARYFRPSFDIESCFSPQLEQMRHSLKPDSRILNIGQNNMGMFYDIEDLWGDYPGVRRRYAEVMTYSQGYDPDKASNYLRFRRTPDLFRLFRCEVVIVNNDRHIKKGHDQKMKKVIHLPSPLPRAFLVGSYKVLEDKHELLKYVTSPAFDPLSEVVLESQPNIPVSSFPVTSADFDSRVQIISSTSDTIDLSVYASQPTILVITDAYSQGWCVESLKKPTIQDYEIMPANYALRAIPLKEGHHKIRLIYRPLLIKVGWVISIAGWVLFLTVWPLLIFRNHQNRDTTRGTA